MCGYTGRLLATLSGRHAKTIVLSFLFLQFVTVFPLVDHITGRLSWLAEVDRRLYALLWNTQGMTALGQVCDACTTSVWSSILLFCTGAFITMITLLLGSGILTHDANNSEEEPESVAT
jgi:hypothetical protein